MRNHKRFSILTLWFLPALSIIGLITIGADSGDTVGFNRASLSVDDLVSTYGLNIYKFDLHDAKGKEYRLILRERISADNPWKQHFGETLGEVRDADAILTVSFTRRDDQFGGVLFSQEEEMNFDVQLCNENTCYSGMATILPIPLTNREGVLLRVHKSGSEALHEGKHEIRLITAQPSTSMANTTGDKEYPRAELVLQRVQ
jgi:hypothetical protein